nr:translocation/assembly module TamB domain-containing protein [Pseudomonas sp. RIT-PI-AD]
MYVGLGLLAILVLLGASLGGLLGTSGGSRWLIQRVPGLTITDFQGRLGGRWSATQLDWRQQGTHLQVREPRFAWSPGCLLRATLCIDAFDTPAITLEIPPSGDSPGEPLALPELNLPLSLRLGQIRIDRFRLDGQDAFSDLRMSAAWRADGLQIDSLSLHRDDLSLELSGHLRPQGGWPLELAGVLGLPAVQGKAWQVNLRAQGDLRERLALQFDSHGYLDARGEGSVQPLAEHLPAELRLQADAFKAREDLPDTLRLEQLRLSASGDLQQGFRVLGQASLPGEGGPLALALEAQATTTGADIQRLALAADESHRLELNGRLDWSAGLVADARLDWQDFPWLRLYPLAEAPPVAVRRLQASLHYADDAYRGRFDADLHGPAGDFSLGSPVQGDLRKVSLDALRLVAGQGKADGRLRIDFADGIVWDTALKLSDLDPAYWLAELPGRLAGTLDSQGDYRGGKLALQAALDVKGRLRGQPADLRAKAHGADANWNLSEVQLRLGDNRISGAGSLDRRLGGRFDLALNRLGQLWPGLDGQASGRLDLSGTAQAPEGVLGLTGQGLGYADNRLQRLVVDARLDANRRGRVQLDARNLRAGDTALGDVSLRAQGDPLRQALELRLQGPLLNVAASLDGRREGGAWLGRLASGDVEGAGQRWRLEQAAPLRRSAEGRITFGAHCWRNGAASLCAGEQRLAPEPQLSYRLRDFPLASLGRWLPDDFAWQGMLDAELEVALPAGGPQGHVTLDAGKGALRLKEPQGWVDFSYDSLKLDTRLQPQRVDSLLSLDGPRLGQLQVEAHLDPRPASKPLSGQFRLSGLDLAVARPFIAKVETLEGRLDGSGSLGGTLLAPTLDGRLSLHDGHVAGDELPTRLEALTLDARILGESATLSGGWRAGERGRASLSGNLGWGRALALDLAIRGEHLPVQVEPYADLDVAPDLRLSLADERLAVTGTVAVPSGKIAIRSLPPQAVKVSGDAQIVGAPPRQEDALQLAMDVAVVVGEERLQFSGFGLTADLAGRLRIGDNLSGHGELSLKNGRYRAYGQRLELNRARLLFAGPLDQPYLDVEAVRKIGDVTAGVRLNGRADGPTTEVFSTPAMSEEQALSYLVLGRPTNSGNDSNALGQAALAMGLSGTAPVTGALAERLGIKDFQLDNDGASGQLSDRLTIRYGIGVQDPTSVVALRYELTKRLYLEAASGLASSLDLFYKRDF